MITNATSQEIRQALEKINVKYKGNVIFKREPEPISQTRTRFTLKVKDSKGLGAKTGYSGRRTVNACWHIHGDLFDALFKINPKVSILSGGQRITIDGGNWQDKNIGSIMNPLNFSDSCKC